ncbi:hypothetical protein ELH67_10900 [Rhizobium ruizarguesonis]|nr:hypothetical protein [Rhizobium ruizarguesonis]TAZ95008.1 hypothetical protein ELH67_10900 [Rhizobium ruizarguesonis]TBA40692.1 hypothetical protein ELH60_10895 [Rhizobium ruizarguesonis]TBC63244.1 hypothetical protein ELH36_10905 [Rhizobium ruizarguesonis]
MMTFDDIEQVDPELVEGGRSVCFYAWSADDDLTLVWSVSLPMTIEEAAFLDLLPEWRELGWRMLVRQE